jgi:hypothetical protein
VYRPDTRTKSKRMRYATTEMRTLISRISILERRIEMCAALFYWPAYIQTWQRDLKPLKRKLRQLDQEMNGGK